MQNRLTERALKYIAAITMIIDHAPYIFPNAHSVYYTSDAVWFHAVGRVAAPIFFWFLARGFHRTRSFAKYAIRLAVFAAITYVPFIWFLDGRMPDAENCLRLNILFTMLAGLIMLRIVHSSINVLLKIPAFVICVLAVTTADYGAFGLALILIFDTMRDDKRKLAAGYSAVITVQAFGWILSSFSEYTPQQFANLLHWNALPGVILVLAAQFLPLLLILAHTDEPVNTAPPSKARRFFEKWGFYAWYPAQFVLLAVVREIFIR